MCAPRVPLNRGKTGRCCFVHTASGMCVRTAVLRAAFPFGKTSLMIDKTATAGSPPPGQHNPARQPPPSHFQRKPCCCGVIGVAVVGAAGDSAVAAAAAVVSCLVVVCLGACWRCPANLDTPTQGQGHVPADGGDEGWNAVDGRGWRAGGPGGRAACLPHVLHDWGGPRAEIF